MRQVLFLVRLVVEAGRIQMFCELPDVFNRSGDPGLARMNLCNLFV